MIVAAGPTRRSSTCHNHPCPSHPSRASAGSDKTLFGSQTSSISTSNSSTPPPAWIRWKFKNIHAARQNARLHLPERDRVLAKRRDGSCGCLFDIISLQNSGTLHRWARSMFCLIVSGVRGCLSVQLDVFTVAKLAQSRHAAPLSATGCERYDAKSVDFIMWRHFRPARTKGVSSRATDICTTRCL
ncbi:hypothetical protein BD626DRAFT_184026 [Schizophyllum amplum]|uniref:Uncharacterized protein n=1 Tax=Schizophyllum amplum TaxID=97359 RepID=A0A550C176_9AGAR|nr:hypothetical protein BD626DRAFT_184026 [Auriculariopsis ampla]